MERDGNHTQKKKLNKVQELSHGHVYRTQIKLYAHTVTKPIIKPVNKRLANAIQQFTI